MSMKDLPNWLVHNKGFIKKLEKLTIASVVDQFPSVKAYHEQNISDSDISYLLTCGSILSQSNDEICQDSALRISQYCLINSFAVQRKDSAALILDTLANNATVALAIEKGYLSEGFEKRLPIAGQLEAMKRKIEYTIEIGNDKFVYANKFQSEFWDSAQQNKWISVSAPTSVGKSFILESWVEHYILKKDKSLIIYLVPTRALINEVFESIVTRLDPYKTGVINIQTLPLRTAYNNSKTNVFIFTQERLNIFYNSLNEKPIVDLLIIDEAHKIGDSLRGIFLQFVLEMTCTRNRNIKVIFASPFTSNPELLLLDAPYKEKTSVIKSSYVTVNQNLIWVEQHQNTPKKWRMYFFFRGERQFIGDFELGNTPSSDSKRLSFVALTLGRHTSGNVVYVNGAADAEKTAKQIADGLDYNTEDKDVLNLIELSEKVIHERFSLNITLRKGVAFHYGNMPLIIKTEIERLFSKGKIKYLICTSTLVEGVNLACKNIFIRGPKKGSGKPMQEDDFWNLAGRAGRWGKEFQGNVICVDTNNERIWNGTPPVSKKNIKIIRATDSLHDEINAIYKYIDTPYHYGMTRSNPKLQGLLSYLCISHYLHDGLILNPYIEKYNLENLEKLDAKITEVWNLLSFPLEIVARNPGISPILMQNLWDKFCDYDKDNLEKLLLANPSSDDALPSYIAVFTRISDTMSTELGYNSKGAFVLALLVIKWMRGYPLARLISERIGYFRKKKKEYKESTVIRNVMEDVERIARYQAPKLLSCYNDLLRYFYISEGRADLVEYIDDVGVFLELGVSIKTQISLISLGFSRTSAVMISEYITSDNLDELSCMQWINENSSLLDDLPALVKMEIYSIVNGIEL
ncbi:DEAD/DEAH box helicase [Morganella morganii]|uniref:DEAD/DEAH box helicase n=2 Tax=Enterobacterales TaxID=91347 RepID=A0AAI9MR85_MORMO|nr:DEAD/DEAH box helicase [Morganella morganii]